MPRLMRLSHTALVVLGMLESEPRSGYDIKSFIDDSTSFFWGASYGQIYPELKSLEEAGYVAGQEVPTGARKRKEYVLTDAGRALLRERLTAPGPLHHEIRDEGVLRFFFGDALAAPEVAANLRAQRARYAETLGQMQAIEEFAEQDAEGYQLRTLRFGIGFYGWLVAWCDEQLAELGDP